MYIVSQVFALLSLVCLCLSLWFKKKNDLITLQIIELILNAISNFILSAYSGVACSIIAILRNVFYKLKINKTVVLCLTLMMYFIYTFVCVDNIIGIIPIIGSVIYAVFIIKSDNMQTLRFVSIINSIFWIIYDWLFMNYIAVLKDVIIFVNAIVCFCLNKTVIIENENKYELKNIN